MKLQRIFIVLTKELSLLLNSVSSYVVLIVFLFLWLYLFFRNVFIVGESSLRSLFDILPWVMLMLAPAVSMGMVSKERDEGTLELLLTNPVYYLEVVLGKYLGGLVFTLIPFVVTIPIACIFSRYGVFDWGIFAGQFLSAVFLAASLLSLGVFISTLFTSQIASLLITVVFGFLFLVSGSELVTTSLPLVIVPLFERLSILSHVDAMARGVIDLRDIWYFVTFIVSFLSLSYLLFIKRKYGNRKDKYASYQFGVLLFIGCAILTNIIGERIPGRIDVTGSQLYTLSSATKDVLKKLPDVVTVTFYASGRLPAQYQPLVRDVKDILRDYKTYGGSKLVIQLKDPSNNAEITREANTKGIREMQFNVIGNEELQLKTGYMGIAIEYGGKIEPLPFIQTTANLEYQLSSTIRMMTVKNKPTITFLTGSGQLNPKSSYSTFSTELEKQFTIESSELPSTASSIIVITTPTEKLADHQISSILSAISQGKNIVWLIDTTSVSPQAPYANAVSSNVNEILQSYGVTVDNQTVYDLRSNELVNFGSGNAMSYVLSYPFWIRSQTTKEATLVAKNPLTVLFPWAGTLTLDSKKASDKKVALTPLIVTTRFSGVKTGSFSVAPNENTLSKDSLKQYTIATLIRPTEKNGLGSQIVVADSNFLENQYLQNSSENMQFGLDIFNFLGQDSGISSIAIKPAKTGKLVFSSEIEISVIKYGIFLGVFIIPLSIALYRFLKRKSLRNVFYSSL